MTAPYWRNGEPTPAAVAAFTEGDCWILAIHLGRMLDWPVYTVDYSIHWVVREPGKDRYLDITGVSTRRQLLRTWMGSSLKRESTGLVHEDMYDESLFSLEMFAESHRRAPGIARRLIAKYVL